MSDTKKPAYFLLVMPYDHKLSHSDIDHARKQIIRASSRVNLSSEFQYRSDTNWAVQPQKMARGLKVLILMIGRIYNVRI